jgi:GTPase Era involved in 16S rRNA processing
MTTMSELRKRYRRFRILVIGRANAGKTTLLQRVCNTTDDPCLYDENQNNLLNPTSERGIHDIHRPFAFRSNPGFIFHDSPGFETGDTRQLQDVLLFIEEKAKSTEVEDQLHAIWFCFVLNGARPLFPLEKEFFNATRAGNVPVIAIFTKFDDLINQIYDMDVDEEVNRKNAEDVVDERFRKPLGKCANPPHADVCFEALHNLESGNHQDQVKALIEKTASSLDNTALRKLFVSVQQNNIDLCVRYAIDELAGDIRGMSPEKMVEKTRLWFGHSLYAGHDYGDTQVSWFPLLEQIRIIHEDG